MPVEFKQLESGKGYDAEKWYGPNSIAILASMHNLDIQYLEIPAGAVTDLGGRPNERFVYGSDILTSVNLPQVEPFEVYPNPSNGLFNIGNHSGLRIDKVEIYDMGGRMVKQVIGNNVESVDLDDQPGGIYLMKIHQQGIINTRSLYLSK